MHGCLGDEYRRQIGQFTNFKVAGFIGTDIHKRSVALLFGEDRVPDDFAAGEVKGAIRLIHSGKVRLTP